MPLESESRWRLIRKAKSKPVEPIPEVSIREASKDDLVQITEIYNFYILNSMITFDIDELTVAEWESKLEYVNRLGLPFIVAISGSGQLLGFAYLAPWRQKAAYRRTVEDTIYLKPAAVGKRIGTALLTELLIRGKNADVHEVVAVISDRGADPSIAMHTKFGFKENGRLAKVGFKLGKWAGVVLMQKSL